MFQSKQRELRSQQDMLLLLLPFEEGEGGDWRLVVAVIFESDKQEEVGGYCVLQSTPSEGEPAGRLH